MSDNANQGYVMTEEHEDFFNRIFDKWDSECPVPMPKEFSHTFSQSAAEVGRFLRDLPVEAGSLVSNNRKKKSKAYLMVERDGDRTGFLWCDADGKAVRRSYIKVARGLAISRVKEDLVEKYNVNEENGVSAYNKELSVALGRRCVVKFAERGSDGITPPVIDEEDQPEGWKKYPVYCAITDPELN
ncbi:hypothetical protein BKA59DRAFT_520016 [Fusarium tricinctum]|uniref:Uncharacterized protein n=1 Tax=Fusarium tricinctum TaxID=61284 RepID=A0A8K0S900_9HYPO|nr:hypothetical protein BKA59DRAFT_520016 [Fusarium tricinctum]